MKHCTTQLIHISNTTLQWSIEATIQKHRGHDHLTVTAQQLQEPDPSWPFQLIDILVPTRRCKARNCPLIVLLVSILVVGLRYSVTEDMLGTIFIVLETLEEDPDD